jgi:hypothetical protein
LRIEALKTRIDRSEYHVEVDKVAVAILGRTTARIWLMPASLRPRGRNGAGPDTPTA